MRTHCTQTAQQMERRWLSALVGSLVLATVVMASLQPIGLVDAAECFMNDDTVAVQDTPNWDAIMPFPQAQPVTVTRDCACELTSHLNSNRFVLGKSDTLGSTKFTACLSLKSGKMGRSDQTTFSPIGKANSRVQTMKASTTPYNSKKPVFTVRLTPPEFTRVTKYQPVATIIGPLQDFQNSPPSDERSMPQTIPSVPPMDKPSALFGDHSWGPYNQFQVLQQLPNGESHRMNMTTSLALHGRDCVISCQ